MKEVVYKALQIAGSDFEKAGICAKREHPDDACFIFGDPETIGVAIDNLLTNVCRWSKCRNVLIEITSDKSGRAFALRVLDDGVGPQSDHVPGVGLRGVLDSARRYCGSFRFDQLQADDSRFAEGYRTLAELELHAISAREGAQ